MKTTLFCFAFVVFCAVLLPRVASRGMFRDGATYASIALHLHDDLKNHAQYNIWHLRYTQTLLADFHEHPPMGMVMLAGFYSLVGSRATWVEALYSMLWGFGLFFSIMLLGIVSRNQHQAWLACLLIGLFPMTSWIYANNMLEGPAVVCCCLAVATAMLATQYKYAMQQLLLGFLFMAWVVLACSIKGPPMLFPLVVPFLYNKKKSLIVYTGAALLVCVVVLWIQSSIDAQEFLKIHTQQQIISSLNKQRELAGSRLSSAFGLLGELLLPLLVVCGLCQKNIAKRLLPITQYWLLVALSASLPILISPKQHHWYMFASLPMFAMAFASYVESRDLQWLQTIPIRTTTYILALIVALMCWFEYGNIHRDKDFVHDFVTQTLVLPAGTLLHVCPDKLWFDWSLHANMIRQFEISLTRDTNTSWYITTNQHDCTLPAACALYHPQQAMHYRIYKCDLSL